MKRDASENVLAGSTLPPPLEAFLWDTNPWWRDRPMRILPGFRRWMFDTALRNLKSGLAPVTVLRGPRQVGKTTLQEQIIDQARFPDSTLPGSRSEAPNPRSIL